MKYIRYFIYLGFIGVLFGAMFGITRIFSIPIDWSLLFSKKGFIGLEMALALPIIKGFVDQKKVGILKNDILKNNYLLQQSEITCISKLSKEEIKKIIKCHMIEFVYRSQYFTNDYEEDLAIGFISDQMQQNLLEPKKKKRIGYNRFLFDIWLYQNEDMTYTIDAIVKKENQYTSLSNSENEELALKLYSEVILQIS
jgi:hypothetical protein